MEERRRGCGRVKSRFQHQNVLDFQGPNDLLKLNDPRPTPAWPGTARWALASLPAQPRRLWPSDFGVAVAGRNAPKTKLL